mmetsp:Transcript_30409/g.98022  ORF Transcript_30409/g.98022 Transcript_30409/m.98022 type:complete len:133 (+) Transcript_30409:1-399(+)
MNDVSERAHQLEKPGSQWTKGKCHDTFAPLGPWLVTKDEFQWNSDPPKRMWSKVDGATFQDGSTATMVFDVPTLVAHVSQFMTLLPGDVIATGTPPGVGMGKKPLPLFLKPGQQVEIGIDGLGSQKQSVVQA